MSLSYFFIKRLKNNIFNEPDNSEAANNYKDIKEDLLAGARIYKSRATIDYGIGNICHTIAVLRAIEGMPVITHRDKNPNKVYYCLYDYAEPADKERWAALKDSTKEKVLNLGASGYFQNSKPKDDEMAGQISFTFGEDGSFMIF